MPLPPECGGIKSMIPLNFIINDNFRELHIVRMHLCTLIYISIYLVVWIKKYRWYITFKAFSRCSYTGKWFLGQTEAWALSRNVPENFWQLRNDLILHKTIITSLYYTNIWTYVIKYQIYITSLNNILVHVLKLIWNYGISVPICLFFYEKHDK